MCVSEDKKKGPLGPRGSRFGVLDSSVAKLLLGGFEALLLLQLLLDVLQDGHG